MFNDFFMVWIPTLSGENLMLIFYWMGLVATTLIPSEGIVGDMKLLPDMKSLLYVDLLVCFDS
jgi:hypothetical protein